MIELKTYDQIFLDPVGYCNVLDCKEDGEKLFSTETRVLDVCLNHYTQLQNARE
jgi:hypothetical protein